VYNIRLNGKLERGFTSVTSLIKKNFAPFDKKGALKAVRKNGNPKYEGMTDAQILAMWSSSGREAASLGTQLHEDIESFFNGTPLEQMRVSPEHTQFKEFWSDHMNTLVPFRTEWEVYHEEAKLAGSIDMVFVDKEDNYFIYDWKRTKQIKPDGNYGKFGREHAKDLPDSNYWHYALQLNTYQYILESKYDLKIKGLYLVRMHPDSETYDKIILPDLQHIVQNVFRERCIPD
jgi:ATP-dependent exoDNAse (exonuclease V) beta subunit